MSWTFPAGLKNILSVIEKPDIKATFFTQGTVAEKFPDEIRELAKNGHLIGSHGYNHENYGGSQVKVWTPEQPIFIGEDGLKKELIKKTDSILKNITGHKPEVFVAPFDNIDDSLLYILDELGFRVDCSYHNYTLGLESFPFTPLSDRKIIEVPLTVLDIGLPQYKNVLESFAYDERFAKTRLKQYLDNAATGPFKVVLITCHPYEFVDVKIPHPREVLITGDEKVNALKELIGWLENVGAEFVTPLGILETFLKEKDSKFNLNRTG